MAHVVYSREEVQKLLALSEGELRGLLSAGLVHPLRGPRRALRFSFQDLVVLRAAKELKTSRLPRRRLRRALQALRSKLPEGASLAGLRLEALGDQLIVREGGAVYTPCSGQLLFDFEVRPAPVVHRRARYNGARRGENEVLESKTTHAAAVWCERGAELEESSPGEARAAYERALALDPAHVDALINLGRLLHEAGQPGLAAKHYRQTLALEPEHAVAWFNLAVALEDQGKLTSAAAAYRSALAADPRQADAHHNLSRVLERLGEPAAALQHLSAYRRLRGQH